MRPIASRREFLASAAGAAVAATARATAAEPGTATSRWRPNYILSSALYGGAPLAEILPEVKKTGCGSLDIWPKPHGGQREEVDALGIDRVRALLVEHGVRLGSMTCYRPGAFLLPGEFDVATRLGGERVVLVTMALGNGEATGDALDAEIRGFFEKLAPSIAAAEKADGSIAIENHANSLLRTPESIRRFVSMIPSDRVGIALAPHHLPQDGALLASLARDIGPKLRFVYAQQLGNGSTIKLPKDEELLQMPGRGPLDFGPLMRELATLRFAGPLEIFMHPVPRGVPILDTTAAVTAEVNRARAYLDGLLPA